MLVVRKTWRNLDDESLLSEFIENLDEGFKEVTILTIDFATSYGGKPGHPCQLGVESRQVEEMVEKVLGLIEASPVIQEVNLNLFFTELWNMKERLEQILIQHPTLVTFNLQTTCASRRMTDLYTLRRPDEGPITWCSW